MLVYKNHESITGKEAKWREHDQHLDQPQTGVYIPTTKDYKCSTELAS
jgi:hypothetical protein